MALSNQEQLTTVCKQEVNVASQASTTSKKNYSLRGSCFIYVCIHGDVCVPELVTLVFVHFKMKGKYLIMLT